MAEINYSKCVMCAYPGITEEEFSFEFDERGLRLVGWHEYKWGEKPTIESLESHWVEVCRVIKKQEMKEHMYDEMENGTSGYTTQNLAENIKVDSGRMDLDNFKNLIIFIETTGQPGTVIKDYNNQFKYVTLEDLKTLCFELITYGLWLYQRKWEKEVLIDSLNTEEEIEAVTFL